MLFSSITFLFYFLPCVFLLYFAVPRRWKNTVLLLASLVFYAWGEPVYVLLMVASTALGYFFGLAVEKYRGTKRSKALLTASVAVSLALLGYFKYTDFFIASFNAATGLSVKLLNIALPIGISFYTFQLISYVADVYRGSPAQRSFIDLAAYITMFPQLIAGPIVRYSDIAESLSHRQHSWEDAAQGVTRFTVGLSKKVLLANALGELCDVFRASGDKSLLFYWLYALSFSLHIYFDFSGYSDMAVGLGRILGFHFVENFNYPYISKSVTEFWRRWHISLGSWFRDYVYIPMGGNRVSTGRWLWNILVVWALTGFWHGAAWVFVVWGLWFALLLAAEKLFLGKLLDKLGLFRHVYVLLAVVVSFVIFNAASLQEALQYLGAMFGGGNLPLSSPEFVYYLRSYGPTFCLAVLGATPLCRSLARRYENTRLAAVARPILVVAALLAVTGFLVDGSYNPFLYFRF